MNRKVISSRTFIIGLLFLRLVTSCSATSVTPTSLSPTSNFISPSSTFAITATSTIFLSPTQTNTSIPEPTIAPTKLPSLTPLPTIPFDEIQNKFEILLATNGGCRLPCFWGMTPGETTEAELKQFGDQFAKEGYTPLLLTSEGIYTFYYFTHRSGDTTFETLFFVGNDKIEAMGIKMETATDYFPLSKILTDYGVPKQIFIVSNRGDGILYMIVLYENEHIVGKYALIQNKLDNSLYCYDPLSINQYIVTWAPGKNWLDYLNREFRGSSDVISLDSLRPLKDVSDYDINSLQRLLKTPNRSICLKVKIGKLLP